MFTTNPLTTLKFSEQSSYLIHQKLNLLPRCIQEHQEEDEALAIAFNMLYETVIAHSIQLLPLNFPANQIRLINQYYYSICDHFNKKDYELYIDFENELMMVFNIYSTTECQIFNLSFLDLIQNNKALYSISLRTLQTVFSTTLKDITKNSQRFYSVLNEELDQIHEEAEHLGSQSIDTELIEEFMSFDLYEFLSNETNTDITLIETLIKEPEKLVTSEELKSCKAQFDSDYKQLFELLQHYLNLTKFPVIEFDELAQVLQIYEDDYMSFSEVTLITTKPQLFEDQLLKHLNTYSGCYTFLSATFDYGILNQKDLLPDETRGDFYNHLIEIHEKTNLLTTSWKL